MSDLPDTRPTDWGRIAAWYDKLVGDEGSDYHRHVVLPGVLRLLGNVAARRLLDVACGQGVLCRHLAARGASVTGVDAAADLIDAASARQTADLPPVIYRVADARTLDGVIGPFDAATCVLAIQNVHPYKPVFTAVAGLLREGGRFVIVMMHPCFRGHKESHWGWDDAARVQYRRVDRYLIPRKSPIIAHPGRRDDDSYTWSFHRPVGDYVKAARQAGLLVDALEEWPSHKTSSAGPRAAAENKARKEIPMFLAVRCVKVTVPG